MSFQEFFPIEMLKGEQWQSLFPLLSVSIASIFALLLCPLPRAGRVFACAAVCSGVVVALIGLSFMSFATPVSILDGVLYFDRTSQIFAFMILAITLASCLMSFGFDQRENLVAELFPLIGFACVGMLCLVSSRNLLFVFIALELMSLAVYVLVSMQRRSVQAAEAGLKYFLLGGAASSVFLYGVTLLYGTTGTLNFGGLTKACLELWQADVPLLAALGLVLIAVGFLFKIGAVPFHSWVPDVYTGASTPVTGFMISGVKLAAVGVVLRIGSEMFATPGLLAADGAVAKILVVVTVLTLGLGSLVGLVQTNLKRLLAYSTIAHTGYLLLGFMALTVGKQAQAAEAIASYSLIYAMMNIGCFAILTLLSEPGRDGLEVKDLAGLGKRRPFLAFALTIFLLSMAGIPPTAGFFGKYYLFASAMASGQVGLTVLAALASVISAALYLRPIVAMYMQEPAAEQQALPTPRWVGAFLVVSCSLVFTLLLGVFPSWLTKLL